MELRQLRYFLALARTLNFTHAAAESHIAQPPFSRQIRALEEELGVPLVNRRSRQLTLTPAGELMQQRASEILTRIDRVGHDARLLATMVRRSFRIGLQTIILYGRFPELLRELRGANPHLHIDVVEMHAERQFIALKEGRIDVGFGRTRVMDADIAQVNLRQGPLFAALSARHPLADLGTGAGHAAISRNRLSSGFPQERQLIIRALSTPFSPNVASAQRKPLTPVSCRFRSASSQRTMAFASCPPWSSACAPTMSATGSSASQWLPRSLPQRNQRRPRSRSQ
jgi:DNA-binding transcriptional LysR family regulator